MPNMKKETTQIKYYKCGYCTNKLKYITKNPKEKTKDFYAGVFLIRHPLLGCILYDTGYSTRIYECGFKGKIYNLLNPTQIKENETIVAQLKNESINIDYIKYVILSHLHPDHIGCTKDFNEAKFIISKDCYLDYKKNEFRSLIFKKMLPDDFEERLIIIDEYNNNYNGLQSASLLDCDELQLVQLDGHSKGQLGLGIVESDIFLAADTCWGKEFISKVDEMHPLAKLVQNNFNDYKDSLEFVEGLIEKGISVYFSHDDIEIKELNK